MSNAEIDQVLNSGVQDGTLPGVVVMAVGPDRTYYQAAFGFANAAEATPMRVDTIFKVSSLTKAVTTAALMQLVERGLLSLDQPASSIVPAFKDIQVLDGFDGGVPVLRPPRREVTVAHLATHTSGLAYDIWSEKARQYRAWVGASTGITGGRDSLESPLMFDPGEAWAYGPGIDWLGEIVQAVTQRRIDDYLEQEIFKPLEMKDTAFHVPLAKRERVSAVHTRRDAESFDVLDFQWSKEPANERILSGHGLYCTVPDYSRFLQMFLNAGASAKGRRVLKPETVAAMAQNRIGDVDVGVMETTNKGLSLDAEFFPGMKKKHSAGFQITTEQWPGMRSAGSLSWAGLLNLFYWWDPERRIAVTFASQLLPFQDKRVMSLFSELEQAIYRSDWARG